MNHGEARASRDSWIVGFDAREAWRKYKHTWDSQRVHDFLLRTDIIKPLSTDSAVWESVFEGAPDMPKFRLPVWIGPNRPLWDDLASLKACLSNQWPRDDRSCWFVAITRFYEVEHRESRLCDIGHRPAGTVVFPFHEATSPNTALSSWQFLGYDVADGSLLSGLSNCGYGTEEEIQSYRERFGGHLNEYHLLKDLDPAVEFRQLTNERIPEHSPFFVYALWLVESWPAVPENRGKGIA